MRAVGIVRVSQVGGREGDSFTSPEDQRERMEAACGRDGMTLVAVHEELDVSGGRPLAERPGLRAAVEAVEGKEAEVVMVAYLDRLARSLAVQAEVVQRVESAGGRVVALDFGEVSEATSTRWLSGTMLSMFNEYQRRTAKERSAGAQARAIARGVPTFNNIPPGYQRGADKTLEPSADAPVVREAFEMRAAGATVREVRDLLRANAIHRTHAAVRRMLKSRIYLGELSFGELHNPTAHEAIIDRDLWGRVQRMAGDSKGRLGKSPQLLARLGVLRCGTCGAAMGVQGNTRNSAWAQYRCPPNNDCPKRAFVSVRIADEVVVEAVKEALRDVEGRASAEGEAREAEATAEAAQADLDAAIRAFASVADEPAALERLAELREVRDRARDHAADLGGLRAALRFPVADEWDRLSIDEQRDFIRAVVDRATVSPGRGAGRVRVHLVGE